MTPPFTIEQFLEVFKNYNETVFPMQVVLYLISAVALYFAIRQKPRSDRIISGVLSFLWLWMGVVYHLLFFADINKAAYLFGFAFIVQGILFFAVGVIQNKFSFKFQFNIYGVTGLILMVFALIVYPVLGFFLGHTYPFSPTFGLPCPTTIFTFGLLLLSDRKIPVAILAIPFLWSVIGFTAAFKFGIMEDIGLLISGLLTLTLILIMNRNYK